MRDRARRLVVIVVFTACVGAVFAQEAGHRPTITILSLHDGAHAVPPATLSGFDDRTAGVFTGLGRFNVTRLPQRLDSESIDSLKSEIEKYRDGALAVPDTIRFGASVFTGAEFSGLLDAFMVVIPAVMQYESERADSGAFTTQLRVSLQLLVPGSVEPMSTVTFDSAGSGDTAQRALRNVTEDYAERLSKALIDVNELRLKTGIIEIHGASVLLEFGRNLGVRRGDEYLIVEQAGDANDDIGLLVVKDVEEAISYAQLVYAERPPQLGDMLVALDRLGLDTSVYVRTIVGVAFTSQNDLILDFSGVIGARQSISRGFYNLRPFIGIEVPFAVTGDIGTTGQLVTDFYAGAELNWYVWRFQIVPSAAFGVAFAVPITATGARFAVSHVGGFADVTISYLIGRDIKIGADLGYAAWFAPADATSYSGIIFGFTGTYKY